MAILVLIAFSFTVSCTTSQVHPLHATLLQEMLQDIKIGDTVKVTTNDGRAHKFKVEQLTRETIEGGGCITHSFRPINNSIDTPYLPFI
jgi:hypothetical protein